MTTPPKSRWTGEPPRPQRVPRGRETQSGRDEPPRLSASSSPTAPHARRSSARVAASSSAGRPARLSSIQTRRGLPLIWTRSSTPPADSSRIAAAAVSTARRTSDGGCSLIGAACPENGEPPHRKPLSPRSVFDDQLRTLPPRFGRALLPRLSVGGLPGLGDASPTRSPQGRSARDAAARAQAAQAKRALSGAEPSSPTAQTSPPGMVAIPSRAPREGAPSTASHAVPSQRAIRAPSPP